MGAKMLPDAKSFALFERSLLRRGFRRLSSVEIGRDFNRLRLEAPRPRKGREAGFSFTANGLEVLVWTTFLTYEGQARDEDAGWVLIKDGDDVRYFSHPLHRTRNFLKNLLFTPCIAKWRVEHRPNCPQCSARMHIVRGRGIKSRYWQCNKRDAHRRPEFLSWDYGLPEEALEFLRPMRKRRTKRQKELRKQGKKFGAVIQLRLRWKVRRLQNLVPAR